MNIKAVSENQRIRDFSFRVIGLSCRGKLHARDGIENQDSITFKRTGGFIAIAVADGVGSCSESHIGSRIAMEVVEDFLAGIESGRIDPENEQKVKRYIIGKWEEKVGSMIIRYSTTLRFAVVCEKYVLLGSIGDGKTIIRIGDTVHYWDSDDDLFLNVTYSLTENTDESRMKVMKLDIPADACLVDIFIASDGISNELSAGKELEFISYITAKVRECGEEYTCEIADWVNSLQEKNGDDKSMMLLAGERGKTGEDSIGGDDQDYFG